MYVHMYESQRLLKLPDEKICGGYEVNSSAVIFLRDYSLSN